MKKLIEMGGQKAVLNTSFLNLLKKDYLKCQTRL